LGAAVVLALGLFTSAGLELALTSVAAPFVVGFGTVALLAIAVARYWSYGFSGVALIEKTIPFWQWLAPLVCKQKNQSGLVSVREKDQVGKSVALAETGTKPDEIPTMLGVTEVFVSCVQGVANVD